MQGRRLTDDGTCNTNGVQEELELGRKPAIRSLATFHFDRQLSMMTHLNNEVKATSFGWSSATALFGSSVPFPFLNQLFRFAVLSTAAAAICAFSSIIGGVPPEGSCAVSGLETVPVMLGGDVVGLNPTSADFSSTAVSGREFALWSAMTAK